MNFAPIINRILTMALGLCAFYTGLLQGEDLKGLVKDAVELSTLDQPGTKPFHLKATYAPSFEHDKDSNRNGTIEIWWESPTRWRRELVSPEFHQVEIVDGEHRWQKNDGDYFPEWLRELAIAIVRPVPLPMDALLDRVEDADVRRFSNQVDIKWDPADEPRDAQSGGNGYIDINAQTRLLMFTGGPGWDGQYRNFDDFHGRLIARIVSSGYVEATAKLEILEDLGTTSPGFFDVTASGGDPVPIDTVVLREDELRQNLLPGSEPFEWPTVKDGPFEGVVWTAAVIDRTGKIREMIPPVADNPATKAAADAGFRSMQFKPFLRDGVPVQAYGKLTVRFKTTRPAGMEAFDTARNYFERARKANFLAGSATAPYHLGADFQIERNDDVQTGRYEDTFLSETEWKREARLGSSRLVRSQSGENHYVLIEGPDASALHLVMVAMEPIPAGDTMTESDWRIQRYSINGVNAIRVCAGPDGPDGELDQARSWGFWFDDSGRLLKAVTSGVEVIPSAAEAYAGVEAARRIDVFKGGKPAMHITIAEIGPADPQVAKSFELKGHEWHRAFTAEVR